MHPRLQQILSNDSEDSGIELTALVIAGTHYTEPECTLRDILDAFLTDDSTSCSIDPLSTVPHLLPCKDDAARGLLKFIASRCSPKEIIIAIQESLEHLEQMGDTDEDTNRQIAILIVMYEFALPRLTLRKKTASATLEPLLSQISHIIQISSSYASKSEGRSIIVSSSDLVNALWPWSTNDLSQCRTLLRTFIDSVLQLFAHCIQSSLAQRSLIKQYPRLSRISKIEGFEEGQSAVDAILNCYKTLDIDLTTIPSSSSSATVSLLLFAHSYFVDPIPSTEKVLLYYIPMILAAFQSNASCIDEALALLILLLHRDDCTLSEPTIFSLSTSLSHLSASHPDPVVRHQAFRALGRVLQCSPSFIRLSILRELIMDKDLPAMRVAAIGLLRDGILEGLHPSSSDNVFVSKDLLRTFGPILFRLDPPDLFERIGSPQDMPEQEEQELKRLIECLGVYYVLLRDEKNKTGVRDRDSIKNVEHSLLRPIRAWLGKWLGADDIGHAMMQLVALQTSLERIDDIVSVL